MLTILMAFFAIIQAMAGNPGRRVQCEGHTNKGKGPRCIIMVTIATYGEHAPPYCHHHLDQAPTAGEKVNEVINNALEDHVDATTQQEFPCPHCDVFAYDREEDLNEHILTAHTTKLKGDFIVLTKENIEKVFGPTPKEKTTINPEIITIGCTGSRSFINKPEAYQSAAYEWGTARFMRTLERAAAQGKQAEWNVGLAEGFDELAANICISIGAPFHAFIPSRTYGPYNWRDHSMTGENRLAYYYRILEHAASITFTTFDDDEDMRNAFEARFPNAQVKYLRDLAGYYIPQGEGRRPRHSNMVRNEDMLANCDAYYVWDPSTAGTRNAFKFIKDTGRRYELLNVSFEATL